MLSEAIICKLVGLCRARNARRDLLGFKKFLHNEKCWNMDPETKGICSWILNSYTEQGLLRVWERVDQLWTEFIESENSKKISDMLAENTSPMLCHSFLVTFNGILISEEQYVRFFVQHLKNQGIDVVSCEHRLVGQPVPEWVRSDFKISSRSPVIKIAEAIGQLAYVSKVEVRAESDYGQDSAEFTLELIDRSGNCG